MENKDTGILLNKKDIELHRTWFKEMCRLQGINVLYKTPLKATEGFDMYGETDDHYSDPILVSCIFDEHPTIWTMKKLGWNSELQTENSIIHVPYDLENLQKDCLFIIPSAIDNSKGRVFKVIRMSTTMVYPASVACEIGPVFESDCSRNQIDDFTRSNFNVLVEEED